MADFPDINYNQDYSFSFRPDVLRTEFSTKNTRQRLLFDNPDDLINIKIRANSADLATFEEFVLNTLDNGADTFNGPYYASDAEKTGTLEIVNGEYEVSYVQPDWWEIKYTAALKDRDLTDEENIYEMVQDQGGFDTYYDLIQATEDAINFNNL